MKPEDREAFEAWCPYQGPTTLRFMREAYEFGLSRCDAQPAVAQEMSSSNSLCYLKPDDIVGFITCNEDDEDGFPVYTEAPAVAVKPTDDQLLEIANRMIPAVEKAIGMHTAAAINKQMLDALKIARGSLNSYTPEYAMVVDAIKAADAAKGGSDGLR